jgi:hypothetical protein
VHTQWRFVNKPQKIEVCERCNGHGYLMEDRQ